MNLSKRLILAAGLLTFFTMEAKSTVSAGTDLFGRGRFRMSGYVGAASALENTYTLVGLGAGYFLTNGLEVGVDGEGWFGNDPNIYKLTPQLRYVFYQFGRLMPYVGGFYRRTYYESLTDLDSYGGRAGLFSRLGGRGYMGLGFVYEKYSDCNDRIYNTCYTTYPEISFSVGF